MGVFHHIPVILHSLGNPTSSNSAWDFISTWRMDPKRGKSCPGSTPSRTVRLGFVRFAGSDLTTDATEAWSIHPILFEGLLYCRYRRRQVRLAPFGFYRSVMTGPEQRGWATPYRKR